MNNQTSRALLALAEVVAAIFNSLEFQSNHAKEKLEVAMTEVRKLWEEET